MPDPAPDYLNQYNERWAAIVESDGQLDREKVARELADYSIVLREVGNAYCRLTGDRISKPHTKAEHVVTFARQHADSQHADDLRSLLWSTEVNGAYLRAILLAYADQLDGLGGFS